MKKFSQKECKIVELGEGNIKKLYCETHGQYLMYVYSLSTGDIGYRCQVGEDLHSHIKRVFAEKTKKRKKANP